MPSRSSEFDAYHKWLGIPPRDQPPNHYRLLGIELFESDADVIDTAADQRMAFLRVCATGEYADVAEKLLNELAAGRLCLLDLRRRTEYDARLKIAEDANRPSPGRRRQTHSPPRPEAAAPARVVSRPAIAETKRSPRSVINRFLAMAGALVLLAGLVIPLASRWSDARKDFQGDQPDTAAANSVADGAETIPADDAGQTRASEVDSTTSDVAKNHTATIQRSKAEARPRASEPIVDDLTKALSRHQNRLVPALEDVAHFIRIDREGNVRQLFLSGIDHVITDATVNHLAGLTKLDRLEIARCGITGKCLAHLQELNQLRILKFYNTKIDDEGLVHLAGLKELQYLSLLGTRITDEGLVHLSGLPKLDSLVLSWTAITDEGLQKLADFSSLRRIELKQTRVTAAGISRFQQAHPGVTVEID